jgi:transcriptional regulator with XRE-family HTH domain
MGTPAYLRGMKFHEKLEALIDRKGWKPPTLWDRLRKDGLVVGRSSVYRWVGGASTPDLEALRSLSRVLEIPVEILIHDEIDLPPADSSRAAQEMWLRRTIAQIGTEAVERLILASLLRSAREDSQLEKPGSTESFNDPEPPPARAPGRGHG